MGRDPIAERGGLNLYGFCRNNSVNVWDYLGMAGKYRPPEDDVGDDNPNGDGNPERDDIFVQFDDDPQSTSSNTKSDSGGFSNYINISKVYINAAKTNGLKFNGSQGTVLVVYSHKELGDRGGANTIKDLDARTNGVASSLNLDDIPKGTSIADYIRTTFGDKQFNNIVFSAHVGADGVPENTAFMTNFQPDSPLVAALSGHLASGGNVWNNWCFGASYAAANPGYISSLSQSFNGATVYYGSGLQRTDITGISSQVADVTAGGEWAPANGRYLDYVPYVPPKK